MPRSTPDVDFAGGIVEYRAMRLPAAILLASLAALPSLAAGALQDEEPAKTELGRRLVHFATIARSDGAFRRMSIDETSLGAIEAGKPLPDGTSIAMETFYGADRPATVFIKEKRGNQWLYGSFEPGAPSWEGTKSRTVCHACHIDAATDLTFMLPVIARFKATRQVVRAACEETGRVPCTAGFYEALGRP
jgi:hypothetical protein